MNRLALRVHSLVMVLLSLLLAAAPARANVSLTYFTLEQGTSATQIVIKWGTETETNTGGYIIRRGDNANPAQARDIHTEPSRGSATTGFDYQYVDSDEVISGQVFYYWLIEVETGGRLNNLDNGQITAGGGTATPTPTSQPVTATPVPPTATPVPPTATPVPPTATPVPPAATQQSGDQAPAATATPRLSQEVPTTASQPTVVPTTASLNTPLVGVTPASPQTAATDAAAAPVAPAVEEQAGEADAAATAAADLAARGEGQQTLPQDPALTTPAPAEGESAPAADPLSATQETDATATPQMLAEAPAAPQAQLLRPTATPRPSDSSGEGDNTSSLLMVIGGGSLCGAALLILVVVFVWRRH